MVERTRAALAARSRNRLVASAAVVIAVIALASGCVMNGTWAAAPAWHGTAAGVGSGVDDVACVAADWCMAVGSSDTQPAVKVWNGTGWSSVAAPSAAPATRGSMSQVECGTPSSCVATLSRSTGSGTDYVVAWDGSQWRDVPSGGWVDTSYYHDATIACAPGGSCLVVNQVHQQTVAWDGIQFTSTPFATSHPAPSDEVHALDCVAADACFAARGASMARWDGTAWTAIAGTFDEFIGLRPWALACSTATRCLAFDGHDAARWEGGAWSAAPTTPAGFGHDPQDLSCTTDLECLILEPNGDPMLIWNSQAWFSGPAAPEGLDRISCVSGFCLAVGRTDTSDTYTYTWTND